MRVDSRDEDVELWATQVEENFAEVLKTTLKLQRSILSRKKHKFTEAGYSEVYDDVLGLVLEIQSMRQESDVPLSSQDLSSSQREEGRVRLEPSLGAGIGDAVCLAPWTGELSLLDLPAPGSVLEDPAADSGGSAGQGASGDGRKVLSRSSWSFSSSASDYERSPSPACRSRLDTRATDTPDSTEEREKEGMFGTPHQRAAVPHIVGFGQTGPSREVTVCMNCIQTRLGCHVRLVGSSPELGGWDPQKGLQLQTSATQFPVWQSVQAFSVLRGKPVEYKYVICNADCSMTQWELCPNRRLDPSLLPYDHTVVTETFGVEAHDTKERYRPVSLLGPSLEAAMATPRCPVSRVGVDAEPEVPVAGLTMIRRKEFRMQAATEAKPVFMSPRPISVPAMDSPLRRPQGAQPDAACLFNGVREESTSQVNARAPEKQMDLGQAFQERYQLFGDGPLGEGSFGLVWRCVPRCTRGDPKGDKHTDRELAAKIVRKANLKAHDLLNLLGDFGEVMTHQAMKHPNIVLLHEHFETEHFVALVLDYCGGGDLFDALSRTSQAKRAGFSERGTAKMTKDVLSAVAYIHRFGYLHRDLKAENILLTHSAVPPEENVFKVCDFGFTSREGFAEDRVGSPFTVAPEVVLGEPYSFPVDLWSLGCIMYMTLSGRAPFYAPTDQGVLRAVVQGEYRVKGPGWDGISDLAKSLLVSLLTKDPSSRLRSEQALDHPWFRRFSL